MKTSLEGVSPIRKKQATEGISTAGENKPQKWKSYWRKQAARGIHPVAQATERINPVRGKQATERSIPVGRKSHRKNKSIGGK